jgi:acyl-homoserine lactone acylase PvdQ
VPVALARQSSTSGRDALNLIALKRMTEGVATTPEAFMETASLFQFTYNWGWVGRDGVAMFSSGRLPVRAEGLDRRLPTLGTGAYEWTGFLDRDDHPHAVGHSSGAMLSWNNQAAPGFVHGDRGEHGSVDGVQLLDRLGPRNDLAGVVGVMNLAATQARTALVWPTISQTLAATPAPSALAAAVQSELDAWVAGDAPIMDADNDGTGDDAGPAIFSAMWQPLVTAVIQPVFGDLTPQVYKERGLNDYRGASVMDKDLRRLLGRQVNGPFNLQYCGAGDLDQCSRSLWSVIDSVAATLSAQYASDDPATWRPPAARTAFVPGLIGDTLRTTNRGTFQQLVEFRQTPG